VAANVTPSIYFKFAIMNIRSIRQHFRTVLSSRYAENEARIITDWVLEDLAQIKRSDIIVQPDFELSESTTIQLENALANLDSGKPVQYVLGKARFDGSDFLVNESVLIPRPETEELVHWAADTIKERNLTSALDVGTGSGCIAISLKKKLPFLNMTAVDVSAEALVTAQENAKRLEGQVEFLLLDFLDESTWEKIPEIDLLVSNPPYIPEAEKQELAEHVRDHEPSKALFVPDDEPLLFYKALCKFAATRMQANGAVLLETHEKWQTDVIHLFRKNGLETYGKNDLYGRPRMVRAIRTR
jgi:release factor glutamine methyltransferase